MRKNIIDRIQEIEAEGCGIPMTDSGNGCGGPRMIDNGDIDNLRQSYFFAGFREDENPAVNIKETLELLDCWDPETDWYTITKIIGDGDNPYTLHLILWDE